MSTLQQDVNTLPVLEYKPELLVYDVQAESEAEGLELLDWLKKHT